MIIFGIDPGTATTGFGVISCRGNAVSWIDAGTIQPRNGIPLAEKLACIYDGLEEKLKIHTPDRVCLEQAFYAKNVHTTLILGHARGVAMLAAYKAGAEVTEYTPREIKKSVVGNGNAAKEQIEYMVKAMLRPPVEYSNADVYDALAVALCDFYRSKLGSMLKSAGVRIR